MVWWMMGGWVMFLDGMVIFLWKGYCNEESNVDFDSGSSLLLYLR